MPLWVYLIFFVVLVLCSIVNFFLVREERKRMTVEKYCSELVRFAEKGNSNGLALFIKRHLVFAVSHKKEIEVRLSELEKSEKGDV